MTFSLQIKDYNTFAPLSNKQIQITNIDSKQTYTQTTDSRGYASFNIKESEKGDLFCPVIIHKDYNSSQHNLSNNITQRTICPCSYANHTAIVYFKQNNTKPKDNINLVESMQFIEYIEWGLDSTQQIKIDYISKKQDDMTYPLNYPFAPGTYIELEAKLSDNKKSNTPLQWGYIALHDELELQGFRENKRAYLLQYINDESRHFHKHKLYNKIGFYLPLQKCAYIAVFASTSEIDVYRDIYLIINTDFKVGKDYNNGAIESKRETQKEQQNYQVFSKAIDIIQSKMPNNGVLAQSTKESLPNWNALSSICTLQEAVWFLQANNEKLNELYQNNQARYMQKDSDGSFIYNLVFDYYRIYPSLAGKIAYIYYRFDVGNEVFVESVEEDSGKYREDRETYIKSVKEVFENKTYRSKIFEKEITFKKAYSDTIYAISGDTSNTKYSLFDKSLNGKTSGNSTNFLDERKEFVKSLVLEICNTFELKLVNIDILDGVNYRGLTHYTKKGGEILINNNLLKVSNLIHHSHLIQFELLSKRLIGTIAHECRHLYIYEKFYQATFYNKPLSRSILKKYLAASLDFYIGSNKAMQKLFQPYKKLCNKTDEMAVYCSTIQGYNYQNIYEIQPNERDPRYLAAQIIGKNTLNLK